jgi:L-ascorbate metabolism protein UlaG (beta-lactamase superfamily)
MEIEFIGHATFQITDGETRLLVDPFLAPNNPAAQVSADDVEPTHVLLTHGHPDHCADAVAVAKRTNASCVAISDLAHWLGSQGLEDVTGPNLGGTARFDWGGVRLVPAWHTNSTPPRASSSRSAAGRSTTSATPASSATCASSASATLPTSRSSRSAASTRWTEPTPSLPAS